MDSLLLPPPPPPPPPPILAYPGLMAATGPSLKKGSYTPTFIVLGVIAGFTMFGCILGQLWARQYLRPRRRKDSEEDGYGMNVPAAESGAVKKEQKPAGGAATKDGRPAET